MKTGIIILFHGSRAEGADDAVRRIIAEVRQRGGYDIVTEAFLQHASPGLSESVQRCVQQQVGKIVIVPFFMQSGAHVTKDIPAIVEEARKRHPAVAFKVTDFVGSHPLITEIVLDLIGKRNAEQGTRREE